jgi:hypothetical protein
MQFFVQATQLNEVKNLVQEMYNAFNKIVNEGGIEPVDFETGDSLDDLLHHSEGMLEKCETIAEILGLDLKG